MTVLFADEVPVHYGFIFLSSVDGQPDLMETCRGQRNGLCGAAISGVLSLVTGLHTGRVPVVVEWFGTEPTLDPGWEDVVEVSFLPTRRQLALTSFQDSFEVQLPAVENLRVRYCASGMDAGHQQDTRMSDEPVVDRYLLQLWPGVAGPDSVARQTSAYAAYWHRETRTLPPPSAEEREAAARAEAERVRLAAERAAEGYERLLWGGRRPSRRLRGLGGNVIAVARSHRDLLDAFEALDPDAQRAAAPWLARRAFEIVGLDHLDWIRAALDAMDGGAALPEPFTEPAAIFPLVRDSTSTTSALSITAAEPHPSRRIHRPSFAVPAIFSAMHPDPLRALVDTFRHAVATFDEQQDSLVSELRRRFIDVA